MARPFAAVALAVTLAGALALPIAAPAAAMAAASPAPIPTVSVGPACGDGDGDSLTVSGTGAPTGYLVDVKFDGLNFGSALGAVPDTFGSWNKTGGVNGVADGLHTISTVFYIPFTGEIGPQDIPGPSTTYLIPCPATPTMSVSPACGDGDQDSLTISGVGAPAGRNVEAAVDGTPFGPADGIVPLADGTWTATDTIDQLGAGTHSITTVFHYVAGEPVADIPGPSATYQVPCTELTVDPPSIAWRPGPVALTLAGAGFNSHRAIGFTVARTALAEAVTSSPAGDFSTVVTVPALPVCGTHDVVATEQPGVLIPPVLLPARTATAQLTITCPALTVAPGTVAASSLPRPLTWTLSGFDADTAVALRIADQPVGVVMTDGSGAMTTALPADRLPCGPMEATAREVGPAAVPEAAAPLLVTCRTPPPTVVAPATLTVVPIVVAAGTPTLAMGSGFIPGRTVRLTWLLPDATAAPGVVTAVVGASGSFTVLCLVMTHSRLGPRELVAAETTGPNIRAASASLLVVPGSLQPGRRGLVTRR